MNIICSDLESILIPEIWINVAKKTGIEELMLTTRDIPDYDVLMKKRLTILKTNGLTLHDIQAIIAEMDPLDGAVDFINWARSVTQIVLVSDTFTQFARPIMPKLGWPTLFCHSLEVAPSGTITGYRLRQKNGKQMTIQSLKSLMYRVTSIGDSYNDIAMLKEAHNGILFCPPDNIRQEFNQFPAVYQYDELKDILSKILSNHGQDTTAD